MHVNKLVDELVDSREAVIEAISKISKDKRETVFSGDWSLKDIIAHLTGWANYQISVIKDLKEGKVPKEPGNIDGFNKKSTETRANLSWDKIYSEFVEASQGSLTLIRVLKITCGTLCFGIKRRQRWRGL